MARIRTLKPEIWSHPKVSGISREARLLFVGLVTQADDDGRQIAAPRRILGELYPYDDDVDLAQLGAWLDELVAADLVCRYEADGVECLHLCGFARHQRIDRHTPSRLPAPPDHETLDEDSTSDRRGLVEDSTKALGTIVGPSTLEGIRGGDSTQARRGLDEGSSIAELVEWHLVESRKRGIADDVAERELSRMHDWYAEKGKPEPKDLAAAWRRWLDHVRAPSPDTRRSSPGPRRAQPDCSTCDSTGQVLDDATPPNARSCPDCSSVEATA